MFLGMFSWLMDPEIDPSPLWVRRFMGLFYYNLAKGEKGNRLLPKEEWLLSLPRTHGGFGFPFLPPGDAWE